MNEDLNHFRKKRCTCCGGYFYKLKIEWPKHGFFICGNCNNSMSNNTYINSIKYNNFKNEYKKW